MKFYIIFITLIISNYALAAPLKHSKNVINGAQNNISTQECINNNSGGVYLTKINKNKIIKALKELKNIYDSKAELIFKEPIIIIRDWKDRIYINGGAKKPIKVELKIGKHIDRDFNASLPIRIFYRKAPPVPWFRLRIRAQVGILVLEAIHDISGTNNLRPFWDAGIGWDFMRIPMINLNLAGYTGIRSVGGGVGLDLTKNFGVYVGYGLIYNGFRSSVLTSFYFAFN